MDDIEKQLEEAFSAAKKDDYDKALAICNAVIQTHPSLPDGLRKRAEIYTRMGDLDRAIADLTEVIKKASDDPSDYFFRGWRYLDKGNAAKAVEDLTKALALGQKHDSHYHDESVHFFRAAALLRLERYKEALADCEHVRDDFLIYIRSAGKITKADIVREAKAGKGKK
jgi:tetratricopeptide (TPR) repeat protein